MSKASVTDGGVTVRITFTASGTRSGNNYRLTKVTAKYTLLDSAFSISNRHIKVVNYGLPQMLNANSYIKDYYPTTNSFSKTYSNLVWVDSTTAPAFVGGYAECKISRGGSSWSLMCRDFLVEKDFM